MIVGEQIKRKIASFPEGTVFTISDFGLDPSNDLALAKALSRISASGELRKVSKGKYYKPKETLLGIIKPADSEIVKDFLEKDGKIVGYITGPQAFATMGLTSQISSYVVIVTGKYHRPLRRGDCYIRFLRQENPITKGNIELLRILDAIRMFREIPAVTPDSAWKAIMSIIRAFSPEKRRELESLSLAYANYVHALLGAMYGCIGESAPSVRRVLSGVRSYKLPISESALPSNSNWNIDEPSRK